MQYCIVFTHKNCILKSIICSYIYFLSPHDRELLDLGCRIETGSGHLGHDLSGSNGFDPFIKYLGLTQILYWIMCGNNDIWKRGYFKGLIVQLEYFNHSVLDNAQLHTSKVQSHYNHFHIILYKIQILLWSLIGVAFIQHINAT